MTRPEWDPTTPFGKGAGEDEDSASESGEALLHPQEGCGEVDGRGQARADARATGQGDGCTEEREEVDGLMFPELLEHFRKVVFLEEPNRRDAGGARFQAGVGILERDATQSKHRYFMPAGLTKGVETCGLRAGCTFLFEDRSEKGEIRALFLCSLNLNRRVTGNSDDHAGVDALATLPDPARILRLDVIGTKVDAIGPSR